jgi:hypothetical protein
MMALLAEGDPTVATFLVVRLCNDVPVLRTNIEAFELNGDVGALDPAPNFLFDHAGKAAADLGHGYIGPEHILLALSRQEDSLGDTFHAAHLTWDEILREFDSITWESAPPS